MVENESEALRWVARQCMGKEDWNRCDFRCLRNVMRVVHERTWRGRLFQTVSLVMSRQSEQQCERHANVAHAALINSCLCCQLIQS